MLAPGNSEEKIIEIAIEAGADEVDTEDDGSIAIETAPEKFAAVKAALETAGFEISFAEVSMVATTEVSLDEALSETAIKLIDMLEDLDDVQAVYTNADFAQEAMDQK